MRAQRSARRKAAPADACKHCLKAKGRTDYTHLCQPCGEANTRRQAYYRSVEAMANRFAGAA